MATQDQVRAYLESLDPAMSEILMAVFRYFYVAEDTLSDEFQIATSIVDVVLKRIADRDVASGSQPSPPVRNPSFDDGDKIQFDWDGTQAYRRAIAGIDPERTRQLLYGSWKE